MVGKGYGHECDGFVDDVSTRRKNNGRAQDYRRIINLASVVSHVGALPEHLDSISYTTSKAAVAGLTKDLAVKWARYNITVNAIAPGWFPSNMTAWSIKEKGETIRKHIPLRRFGGDDELKTAVLFWRHQAQVIVQVLFSMSMAAGFP